jgi:hypothetical protein
MKNPLFLILLWSLFANVASAQVVNCDSLQRKSISKITRDYTYAKTFPMMKRNGEPSAAALVMSEGSVYCIKFSIEGGDNNISNAGIIINLVNNGNVIASSFNKVTLRYQDGFIIKCEKTGMYYFNYQFREKERKEPLCGYISVGFKRSN